MYVAIFLISLSLFSVEIPELILKSSKEYDRERKQIKNYKVLQEITSEMKTPLGVNVEKRKQVGYFVIPDKYFFFTKEKTINGQLISASSSDVEKTTKKEIEWLSAEGLRKYQFSLIEEGFYYHHFYVLPKEKFSDATKGEIWIQKESGKISRILKEPVSLKPGLEKFQTEIFFDIPFLFQEPSFTRVQAVYYENNKRIEAKVEVIFSEYQFNQDLSKFESK
jgi:hypothetical protein